MPHAEALLTILNAAERRRSREELLAHTALRDALEYRSEAAGSRTEIVLAHLMLRVHDSVTRLTKADGLRDETDELVMRVNARLADTARRGDAGMAQPAGR